MHNEFENSLVRGIHKSRYIASWINVGGGIKPIYHHGQRINRFRNWLASLMIDGEYLTPEEIQSIINFAENGKLELESSAREYLKEHRARGDSRF